MTSRDSSTWLPRQRGCRNAPEARSSSAGGDKRFATAGPSCLQTTRVTHALGKAVDSPEAPMHPRPALEDSPDPEPRTPPWSALLAPPLRRVSPFGVHVQNWLRCTPAQMDVASQWSLVSRVIVMGMTQLRRGRRWGGTGSARAVT